MTRDEWIKKVVRKTERKLAIPAGWWGCWTDVHGPRGERVRCQRINLPGLGRHERWIASLNRAHRSVHGSRVAAIRCARGLASELL